MEQSRDPSTVPISSEREFVTPETNSYPLSAVENDLIEVSLSAVDIGEEETCECDLGLGRQNYELRSNRSPSNVYLLQDVVTKYGAIAKNDDSNNSTNTQNSLRVESAKDCETAKCYTGTGKTTGTPSVLRQDSGSSIGTSLQQHKNICRKDVENVFINKMIGEIQQESSNFGHRGFLNLLQYIDGNGRETDMGTLRKKFFDALDEVEHLKSDLTARCRQLESKHRAIEILQVQLEQAYRAHRVEYEACQNLDSNCKKLEKELDEVKWEFEVRDYQVGQSQESWSSRLEIVERENAQLQAALQRTQVQLKCVQRENSIMNQEKQELLCLMQLSQNERHVSSLVEADTYHLTPAEMSVLGACNCDSSQVHPCRCAWTLVNSRREIQHLQNRVKDVNKNNEDNLKIMDLYKNAFEAQLERNKKLFVRMVNKQLRHSSPSPGFSSVSCMDSSRRAQGDETRDDNFSRTYMLNIIDMLRDRTEELFHKRLSTQLLADKIHQLEKQIEDLKLTKNTPNSSLSPLINAPPPSLAPSDIQEETDGKSELDANMCPNSPHKTNHST